MAIPGEFVVDALGEKVLFIPRNTTKGLAYSGDWDAAKGPTVHNAQVSPPSKGISGPKYL